MKCAMAIFAKSPVRGAVKTRLCPPLTPDQATELYRAFLLDTMHVISALDGIEPGVLFTPDDAHDDFRALAPSHFFLVPQRGDGFGMRLANGFHDLFAAGYEAVAIMDADSPTLPRAHIARLFEQLSDPGCDVSVGPCDDGGYWAIGMKRLHPEVLSGITWSTELVLAQTLHHAQDAHLQAVCAPTWHDVDTGEALERLRVEVTAPLPLAPGASSPDLRTPTKSSEQAGVLPPEERRGGWAGPVGENGRGLSPEPPAHTIQALALLPDAVSQPNRAGATTLRLPGHAEKLTKGAERARDGEIHVR